MGCASGEPRRQAKFVGGEVRMRPADFHWCKNTSHRNIIQTALNEEPKVNTVAAV